MSNYYTPDISEFHISFEYERFVPISNAIEEECWDKLAMSVNYLSLDEIDNEIIEKEIRVKYLDRQDIEELGFTIESSEIDVENNHFHLVFTCNQCNITYRLAYVNWYTKRNLGGIDYITEDRLVKITSDVIHDGVLNTSLIFRGDIKNKSELKTLLKQLNINN